MSSSNNEYLDMPKEKTTVEDFLGISQEEMKKLEAKVHIICSNSCTVADALLNISKLRLSKKMLVYTTYKFMQNNIMWHSFSQKFESYATPEPDLRVKQLEVK